MTRVLGVLWHPRQTMSAVVREPSVLVAWAVVLGVVVACAAFILSSDVGQQALVDERIRTIELLGGGVNEAAYAELQARPPLSAYLTSGGRLLVTPVATVLVALALMALAALDGARVRFAVALAIVVHASVVLALQQVVAVPAQWVRESLGSPTSLATVLPIVEDGTWLARALGTVDVFGVWWVVLLSIGLAAATGQSTIRCVIRLGATYLIIAASVASAVAVLTEGA